MGFILAFRFVMLTVFFHADEGSIRPSRADNSGIWCAIGSGFLTSFGMTKRNDKRVLPFKKILFSHNRILIFSMKKLFVSLFSLFSLAGHAQQEGVVHYTRTTYWTRMYDQLTFISKQEKERLSYMFSGKDDWREYTLLYFNGKASKYEESDEKSDESEGYAWRKSPYMVRRDFESNTMTDIIELAGKTYIIEDTLRMSNWKILNELKDVAGHICMKAVTEDTVKKQKIVAWFAQDLPLPIGPERLCGLPGLILELDINDGTVLVEATKITARKLTTELNLPKKLKGAKLTEAAYQQALGKFIREKIKEERSPYWGGVRY